MLAPGQDNQDDGDHREQVGHCGRDSGAFGPGRLPAAPWARSAPRLGVRVPQPGGPDVGLDQPTSPE